MKKETWRRGSEEGALAGLLVGRGNGGVEGVGLRGLDELCVHAARKQNTTMKARKGT